ncbi:MAG: enoyl-CoA hydratase/isomerase family protein [Pseudomonadota bacterium]
MNYQDFHHIKVAIEDGIATCTIDNPPINLITRTLFQDLNRLSEQLETDEGVIVVVLQSANPDFFIAHYDVELILQSPTEQPPVKGRPNGFHAMVQRFHTMEKLTIAKIEGRVGGGGSELAANCDLRYGVYGKTLINQMEVPIGILPGGTGTQQLPRLMGRSRALEVILGGDDLDAATAEKWGYLTRAFESGDIDGFVNTLAARVASFPRTAVQLAKQAVNQSHQPIEEGLKEESWRFQQLLRTDEAMPAMRRFLAEGGQTPDGEQRVGALNAEINRSG